ncbi:MAG: Ppx/GppA family phosphatase [Frankiales bacterium]|nr:Ppx/GppA family phosphatase [Frankiales bacterium]
MSRVAAVDCGTNSIRLLVSDVSEGTKRDVHREMRVVRLGQGVDRTGRLAPEALARTREALVDYGTTCRDLGVARIRMVATSATRDAENRSDFVAMVEAVLGVQPEVISGGEEAALSFDGATRGLDRELGPFLVADIGGGSTEIVLGTDQVKAARSVDVGCVRLTERRLLDDPPTPEQVAAAEADIDAALELVRADVPVAQRKTFIGLAGSVTTVAALALGLKAYDRDRIHLSRISADDVRRVTGSLLGQTRKQRGRLGPMHPGRNDVIGAGALVLRTLVDRLDVDEVLVSESDILDGIVWSIP